MSDKSANIDQTEAIQYAIAILKEAGINAGLLEIWRGGDRQMAILMKNISDIPGAVREGEYSVS